MSRHPLAHCERYQLFFRDERHLSQETLKSVEEPHWLQGTSLSDLTSQAINLKMMILTGCQSQPSRPAIFSLSLSASSPSCSPLLGVSILLPAQDHLHHYPPSYWAYWELRFANCQVGAWKFIQKMTRWGSHQHQGAITCILEVEIWRESGSQTVANFTLHEISFSQLSEDWRLNSLTARNSVVFQCNRTEAKTLRQWSPDWELSNSMRELKLNPREASKVPAARYQE